MHIENTYLDLRGESVLSNILFIGTNERVCLITGPLDSVSRILDFVMEKIREKPDPNAKTAMDFDNKVTAEREKQVKLLIPNSTAGMIIGKGGQFIKQLKDESGAFIQISQKSKDTALQVLFFENVITSIQYRVSHLSRSFSIHFPKLRK